MQCMVCTVGHGFVLCFTQREKENAEKKQREEIERLNDNDEVIIEVHIVHIQLPIHIVL